MYGIFPIYTVEERLSPHQAISVDPQNRDISRRSNDKNGFSISFIYFLYIALPFSHFLEKKVRWKVYLMTQYLLPFFTILTPGCVLFPTN